MFQLVMDNVMANCEGKNKDYLEQLFIKLMENNNNDIWNMAQDIWPKKFYF